MSKRRHSSQSLQLSNKAQAKSKRTQQTWLFAGVLVAALILLAIFLNVTRDSTSADSMDIDNTGTSPEIGSMAPNFVLKSVDGDQVYLSDYRGKPVIVNFWATWCPPCRAELPALEEIWQKYDGEIVVLGLAQGESKATVADFVRSEVAVSFPMLPDSNKAIGNSYWVNSLPTTYFIDAEGVIKDMRVGGPLTVDYIEERIALLRE